MQKIILIALLATCAIAAQVNVASKTGLLDGYVVSMGVIQKCHYTCATCDGPLETNCLTCVQAAVAANSMTVSTAADATKGKCGCHDATKPQLSVLVEATPKLSCEAATQAVTHAQCAAFGSFAGIGADAAAMACVLCPSKFMVCDTATAAPSAGTPTGAAGCWAGINATGTDCVYAATTSYISGDVTAYNQGTATASIVNGYFYTATGFVHAACAKGCISCTSAAAGCVCATGFTIVGTTQACECVAAGNFATVATAAAVDACTKCPTGCTACTSATVCTTCDSSTHKLGSTTSTSSTCESIADTSATSTDDTTTTSGTADGETSATATATNGVLITAASMLLAVILA